MPAFPSKLTVSSFYSYLPRQKDRPNEVVKALKRDGFVQLNGQSVRVTTQMAKTILSKLADYSYIKECFVENTLIIPMPGHAPRRDLDAVWPTKRFAQEIASNISASVVPALERIKVVPKSAFAEPRERPDPPTHYDSVKLNLEIIPTNVQTITLLDDIVTRGSSFVAFYTVLKEHFPNIPIRCFALIRTLSSSNDGQFIDPTENVVEYENGRLVRRP